jgi:hypothetical protein
LSKGKWGYHLPILPTLNGFEGITPTTKYITNMTQAQFKTAHSAVMQSLIAEGITIPTEKKVAAATEAYVKELATKLIAKKTKYSTKYEYEALAVYIQGELQNVTEMYVVEKDNGETVDKYIKLR